MRRRDFLVLIAAATAWPFSARAEQNVGRVIGFLQSTSPLTTAKNSLAAFREGLKSTGWNEGNNLRIEYRWAEGQYSRLPALATELVRQRVAVIAAPTLPSALAAKAATATIPIVFLVAGDPMNSGLVSSFNRPGGNVTGIDMIAAGLTGKWLEVLHELAPRVTSIGLLLNPDNTDTPAQTDEARTAARALGRRVLVVEARNDHDIEVAFTTLKSSGGQALVVGADPFFTNRRHQIVALAARYSIPTLYQWREFVTEGGLISYGASLTASFGRVGNYVGKILNGAKPGDLPVERPRDLELVVNLETAKALGLTVPASLLARADEVIE
jgi:putative tryptophan/tyrosine transport system substrate-binding protein